MKNITELKSRIKNIFDINSIPCISVAETHSQKNKNTNEDSVIMNVVFQSMPRLNTKIIDDLCKFFETESFSINTSVVMGKYVVCFNFYNVGENALNNFNDAPNMSKIDTDIRNILGYFAVGKKYVCTEKDGNKYISFKMFSNEYPSIKELNSLSEYMGTDEIEFTNMASHKYYPAAAEEATRTVYSILIKNPKDEIYEVIKFNEEKEKSK